MTNPFREVYLERLQGKQKKLDVDKDGKLEKSDFEKLRSEEVEEIEEAGLKDACWTGYTAVGMKMKNGKKVPNCVPVKEEKEDDKECACEDKAKCSCDKEIEEGYNDNRRGFGKRPREDDEYHVPDPKAKKEVKESTVPDHMKGKQKPYVSSDGKGNFEVLGNTGQTKATFTRKEHGAMAQTKARAHLKSKYDSYMKEDLDEERINGREYASHGLMHPDHAKMDIHKVSGQHVDFYASKTGDKMQGKVTKNDGKSVHIQAHKDKELGDGKLHKFKVQRGLPKSTNEETTMEFTQEELQLIGQFIEIAEKLNMDKATMGDVIKDFKKSDAPQFAGKSAEKRRQMAIAAKLSNEEIENLQELSKDTLDSYREKAFRDQPSTRSDNPAKYDKRKAGRSTAFDKVLGRKPAKEVKEEFEIDEKLTVGGGAPVKGPNGVVSNTPPKKKPSFVNSHEPRKSTQVSDAMGRLRARMKTNEAMTTAERDRLAKADADKYTADRAAYVAKHGEAATKQNTDLPPSHPQSAESVAKKKMKEDMDIAEGMTKQDRERAADEQARRERVLKDNPRIAAEVERRKKAAEAAKAGVKEGVDIRSFAAYNQSDIDEAMWPGTPEYKKKFPDSDREKGTTKKGSQGTITGTGTGVRHERDYEKAEKETSAPEGQEKRGRGRPKGASSGARQKGM